MVRSAGRMGYQKVRELAENDVIDGLERLSPATRVTFQAKVNALASASPESDGDERAWTGFVAEACRVALTNAKVRGQERAQLRKVFKSAQVLLQLATPETFRPV